jgi:hypothetical protein
MVLKYVRKANNTRAPRKYNISEASTWKGKMDNWQSIGTNSTEIHYVHLFGQIHES